MNNMASKTKKKKETEIEQALRGLSTPSEFPQQLLNQIKENSNGGFFLVAINGAGNLSVHFDCDNDIACLAVVSQIEKWVGATRQAHDNAFMGHYFNRDEDDDEDEEVTE